MQEIRGWLLLLAGLTFIGCSEGQAEQPGPKWNSCERIRSDRSLAEKAAYFDRVAREQHLAGDGLMRNINLSEDLQSIESFKHAESTILWSGMYLASQAFRYAVTEEAEAQVNARTVVDGLHELTLVTGVSGLYGRSMDRPDVAYDYDGRGTPWWTESDAPGYEGWAFRNDVSKDSVDGLMFGYAVALEHFDDPQLVADIRDRVAEVVRHVVDNGLRIVDTDGEVTEHGSLYHSAMDDFPGFNAMLASSWIKVAQVATDDAALDDFYYGCLMGMRAGVQCPDIEIADLGTYIESMEDRLFLFLSDCKQNYDNFDMCYQAMYPLLRRETDDGLKERLLGVLRNNMFHTDDERHQSMAEIGWTFFTFAFAGLTGDEFGDDPVLDSAVDLAVCTLKDFPNEKFDRYIPAGTQEDACRNRHDEPTAAEPIPLAEYYFDNYLWRLDPFMIQPERQENRRLVWSPEDYLVAYWMGRLHGLIGPEL